MYLSSSPIDVGAFGRLDVSCCVRDVEAARLLYEPNEGTRAKLIARLPGPVSVELRSIPTDTDDKSNSDETVLFRSALGTIGSKSPGTWENRWLSA